MQEYLNIFSFFIIYSIVGFILEIIWYTIEEKKFRKSTGFLIGPWCPIYGVGALIILYILKAYSTDPVALFIQAVVYTTILEYITSSLMEKIFRQRWWDYSHEKFNLNGRICLRNSLAFGVAAIGLIYIMHPFFSQVINLIPVAALIIINSIVLLIFLFDIVVSIITVVKFRDIIKSVQIKPKNTLFNFSVKSATKLIAKPTRIIALNIYHILKKFPGLIEDNENISAIKKALDKSKQKRKLLKEKKQKKKK